MGNTVTLRFTGTRGELNQTTPQIGSAEVAQRPIKILIVDDDGQFLDIIPKLVASQVLSPRQDWCR
jgi:hypothetical protein